MGFCSRRSKRHSEKTKTKCKMWSLALCQVELAPLARGTCAWTVRGLPTKPHGRIMYQSGTGKRTAPGNIIRGP